jgi:hypothetical protein
MGARDDRGVEVEDAAQLVGVFDRIGEQLLPMRAGQRFEGALRLV